MSSELSMKHSIFTAFLAGTSINDLLIAYDWLTVSDIESIIRWGIDRQVQTIRAERSELAKWCN